MLMLTHRVDEEGCDIAGGLHERVEVKDPTLTERGNGLHCLTHHRLLRIAQTLGEREGGEKREREREVYVIEIFN